MKTAVIILNWNTRAYLGRFLPPLLDSISGLDAEAVVVDNASTDGSADYVNDCFPELRTLRLDRNYGFTGGYNRAVAELLTDPSASPEYIVLLNTDIETEPGWLEPLTEYLDSHPECGVCGPKLLALRQEGKDFRKTSEFEYAGAAGGYIDRFGFPFCRGRVLSRTEEDFGQYDNEADVFWVSGACLVTRSSLWTRLGGLDERFFAHMEEIDYCWRAALAGYRVRVIPGSRVWHIGGGTLPQGSPFKLKLNYRNSLLMLHKNLPDTIGLARARKRLGTRLLIDNLAAAAYLVSGHLSSRRAVVQAHREYRRLLAEGNAGDAGGHAARRKTAGGNSPAAEAGTARTRGSRGRREAESGLPGMFPFSIIVKSIVHGDGVFEYLRNHENNH